MERSIYFIVAFKLGSENIVNKGWRLSNRQNQLIISHLIEYNMRSNFSEKPYTECDGEASSRLFYKNFKFSISLDQESEML